MMKLNSLGNILARRSYANSDGGVVEVLFGKPEIFPKGEGIDSFYYGPYQILGVGDDLIMYSVGIDEVDAISNAFIMAGARLYSTKPAMAGKLKWAGSDAPGELGFKSSRSKP